MHKGALFQCLKLIAGKIDRQSPIVWGNAKAKYDAGQKEREHFIRPCVGVGGRVKDGHLFER